MHADVVAPAAARLRRGGAVDQLVLEVLVLQHLTELLGAPVGDQELQPGAVAQPAVAVVAEDADDAAVDVGDLVERDPGAEPDAELGVGGQAAADPEVEAGAVLGVDHADEGDVVDLVGDVQERRAGDGGLELARQVGEVRVADEAALDLVDGGRAVDDLVLGDTGHRGAEDDARGVAAGLGGGQADGLQLLPDRRDVLDPDPVVLDVLPVGQVGGVAAVLLGDLGDGAQLGDRQPAAVDPDPEHEVLGVELVRFQDRGLAAVDPFLALGVEPPPAHPAAQIGRVDRVEAPLGVDRLNTCPHIETVVVLLELLVGVQGGVVAHAPLALAAVTGHLANRGGAARGGALVRGLGGLGGGGHGEVLRGRWL